MAKLTTFKREYLQGVKQITKPMSRVELVVAHTVTERNRINATEPGKSDKYIVTLKAVPADQLNKLKELFKDSNETAIENMRNVFLTASLWINDPENPPVLPLKGEKVMCAINYVPSRDDKEKLVLRTVAFSMQPSVVAPDFSFDEVFEEVAAVNTTAEMEKEEITH